MPRFSLAVAMAGLVAASGGSALAHEFWIDPVDFVVPRSAPLVADIRVGEAFEGSAYSYVPPNFTRFEVALGDRLVPVEGRAGDRPALNMAVKGAGLAVVAHVTRNYRLTYTDWQKFVNFVTHKDALWVLDAHAARGLSQDRVVERYSRHAKSLMAVDGGDGSDRALGLLTEIVAGANPYTEDMSGGMPVQVLYEGAPRQDVQVELFDRAPDGSVTVTLHRTDAEGRVTLPVVPGHAYLVDSVVLRALEPATEAGEVWESLWASLTFAVPQ